MRVSADVPIIACADLVENVWRIQQAGADFALSVSQVAGQLLAHHVLGEMVSQQARIKLGKLDAGRLAGRYPLESGIRDRTGCSVVAVERAGEVIMDIPPSFILTEADAVYVCGTVDARNSDDDLGDETRNGVALPGAVVRLRLSDGQARQQRCDAAPP